MIWESVAGEPIVHAVADASRDRVVGVTAHHLFSVDFAAPKIQIVAEVLTCGRIAVGSKGSIVGPDGPGHLWRFNGANTETRTASLPAAGRPLGKVARGLGQVSADRVTLHGG